MSFEVICKNCGAPSGHSVGFCPFCKCPMTDSRSEHSPSFDALSQSYGSGAIDLAVVQVNKLLEDRNALLKDENLLMLAVKVLLESEAPRTRLATLLAEGMLQHPQSEEIKIYYKISEAKNSLKEDGVDEGEAALRDVLKGDPTNVHANFILGSHLFWDRDNPRDALRYLEASLRQHPKFKRAWGCLGAAYEKLGNPIQAQQAFAKFKELETNVVVKDLVNKIAA